MDCLRVVIDRLSSDSNSQDDELRFKFTSPEVEGVHTMADRKQFLTVAAADKELLRLLEQSRGTSATEEELCEQRISFAFGNALGSKTITKDSVRRASKHIKLLS